MVSHIAKAALVPESLAASAIIGIVSAALGSGLEVQSGGNRRTRGNLFLPPLAQTGTGKDLAFNLAVAPLQQVTAAKLAPAARAYERKHRVHAGTVALDYGKTASRMPVAVRALKLMNMDTGARRLIADALRRRLFVEETRLDPAAAVPSEVLEVLPVFGAE